MISTNVGKNIAQLRKSKGKTAEQLANALRVSRQTISKWERGDTVPTAYNMVDIATYLDIPISDIYVQIVSGSKHTGAVCTDIDFVNQFLDPKNVERAIVAYDRNPNKLMVKVGVNVITYSDILLLSTNMGYFKGYSEIENPVSFHLAKDCDKVVPELVQHLKNKGFMVFYAGGQFDAPEKIINSDFNGINDGAEVLVVVRDEKELLDFKSAIRNLFTGIVNVKCERDWCDPSGMKYLLCENRDVEDLQNDEQQYEYWVSKRDTLSDEYKKLLDKKRKTLDEEWEEAIDNVNPIQYIKNDQELANIRKQLGSLDEKTMAEFAEACFGNIKAIQILDLQNRKFLPLKNDSTKTVTNNG